MPALLDMALAIFVLVGAFLLFGVAKQLLADTKKDSDNDQNNTPST
jgi:hypothetical protein